MLVDASQFLRAVSRIKDIIGDTKGNFSIMLDTTGEGLKVCFATNTKAQLEYVAADYDELDVRDKVCVNYDMLLSAIDVLKPSGNIRVHDFKIEFGSNGQAVFSSQPSYDMSYTEESGEEVREEKQMGIKIFKMLWMGADTNARTSLLARTRYSTIFEDVDKADQWDIGILRNAFLETSLEKSRVVYFSPKNNRAFVCNTAFMSSAFLGSADDGGATFKNQFIITSDIAKSLAAYLGKADSSDNHVYVRVIDNKFLCLRDEQGRCGLWVEMSAGSSSHISTFANYNKFEYKGIRAMFMREFLQDVVRAAVSSTGAESTEFTFRRDADGYYDLLLKGRNASLQTVSEFQVACDRMDYAEGVDPSNVKLVLGIKIFSDMLSRLHSDIVALDIQLSENDNPAIRLSDIDMYYMADAESDRKDNLGLGADDSLPSEHEDEIRMKSLMSCGYAMCGK